MSIAMAGDIDYACARVAAREGARADAAAWGRIETARDLRVMLDAARASPLREWTAGIAADGDPHRIERALRIHWRSLAHEVAQWMPARWQPAVTWAALLDDLPIVDAMRRREPVPAWIGDDEPYRSTLERATARIPAHADGAGALRAWRDELARRLPPSHAREAPMLPEWIRILAGHESAMRAAPPGDAALVLQSLRSRLRSLRRRATLEATAVFVFLNHCALDLARFRGEIMRRRLLPHVTATS
jgi:hypothetical protein